MEDSDNWKSGRRVSRKGVIKPENPRFGRDKKCGTVGVGGKESAPKLSTVSTMGEVFKLLVIEFSSSKIDDILSLEKLKL